MKMTDFWKEFEKTGSIESYLLYKKAVKDGVEISKELTEPIKDFEVEK